MFGTILSRMILWELCKVFLLSLSGITGILLMGGIIAEATQQGLGPGQILAAIPLLVPSLLPFTIPATTLFATCVVYGRLAADNEVLAIKSSGVNVLEVVKPGLVLGLAMSAATLGLYYHVIPYTHHLLRAMVFNDAEELLYSLLRKHNEIRHSQLPYAMFVKGVQGKKLLNPVFTRKNSRGEIDIVATAREAELRVNLAKKQLLIHMRHGVATCEGGDGGDFQYRVWEVPLPAGFGKDSNRKARDMTWQEVRARQQELEAEKEGARAEIADLEAREQARPAPREPPKHLANLRERLRQHEQQGRLLDVELLMRPALSLGCLCFVLVGCPVGIWFSRSDYLSSFITCFLPIVFLYYPLMLCGTNMAKEARGHHQVLLVWGADLLIGAVGLTLFRRLLKN